MWRNANPAPQRLVDDYGLFGSAFTLVTPTGRLEAVASRLDSMIYAVTIERTALNDFYASLNDDQKARFGAEIRQPPRAREAPP